MPDETNTQPPAPSTAGFSSVDPSQVSNSASTPSVQAAPTPAPAQTQTPAPQAQQQTAPQPSAPEQPTPQQPPMPTFDTAPWDKQKVKVGKNFFPAFSPRLFGNPFSFAIDKDRAKKAAEKKGYQMVDKGMILLTPGKFMGQLMIEVAGGQEGDTSIIKIDEVYSKVSEKGWGNVDKDIAEAEKELGQKAKAVYLWQADPKHIVIFVVV